MKLNIITWLIMIMNVSLLLAASFGINLPITEKQIFVLIGIDCGVISGVYWWINRNKTNGEQQ